MPNQKVNFISNIFIIIYRMSQFEKKHRLSTITTSAGLSNARRLKTSGGPQFNTIHQVSHSRNSQVEKQSMVKKSINALKKVVNAQKESRRYSEGDWSMKSIDKYGPLKKQQKKIKSIETRKKSLENHRSESYVGQNPNKIRIKSEYNITQHKIFIPLGKQEEGLGHQRNKITNSDEYMDQLQKQKNKRIKQIYNPQSAANSKASMIEKSLSALRKNRNRVISSSRFKTQQLIQAIQKQKHNESHIPDQNEQRQGKIIAKIRQAYPNKNNKYINRINLEISDGSHERSLNRINYENNGPKILPVTFQRIEKLSTIDEGSQSQNRPIFQNKGDLKRFYKEEGKQKQIHKAVDHTLTPSNISDTPRSQHGLPFPKFNNFFENYQNSRYKSENKTSIFQELKHQKVEKINQTERTFIDQIINKSSSQNERMKDLTIFNSLDKSTLKIIKMAQGVYYGQTDQDGNKSGKGAIFYQNGKLYEGEFRNNMKEGAGTQIFTDGSSYIGQYRENKRNGKGRFQWPNGQIYDGQWQNNLKHGSGLWENSDSTASYIGQWCHGVISGFGVLTNQKGERYQGQFKDYNKQGHGTYRFENGDRLVGSFKRNKPTGQCQYFWYNGDYFKGAFSNGLRHGRGVIKYVDNSYFEGEFRNDKKCGLGKQHYHDGIIYYGNYENDLRHGYGKLIYEDEVYYEGYWLNNVAVIFQQQNESPQQIIEDEKQRLASGFSNKISEIKLKKLGVQEQQKIMKSMRNRQSENKAKVQKFSSKNLLQRLCQPKKRCKCLLNH